jgi:hypothetical protein
VGAIRSVVGELEKCKLDLVGVQEVRWEGEGYHTADNFLLEFHIPKKLFRLIKMCLNEAYSKVPLGKYLSDTFSIQNGLKQGDALSPLLFNFALEYAISDVQENQVGLELNETHQLFLYVDDANLLDDSINTMKEITEKLLEASRTLV